jgi:hypothetical protein
MCTVPLPPGGTPIAVDKYIMYHISYHKKVIERKICVLVLSTALSETLFVLRRTKQRITIKRA